MMLRCRYCDCFLGYVRPFDGVGIDHRVCVVCQEQVIETRTDDPRINGAIWASWQDEGGGQ